MELLKKVTSVMSLSSEPNPGDLEVHFDMSQLGEQVQKLPDGSWTSPICKNGELQITCFDDVLTMCDAFRQGARTATTGNCLGSFDASTSQYKWESYERVVARIEDCASGLYSIVMKHQVADDSDKLFIGLWSQNRAEFLIVQQTCFHLSYVVVPLYDTLGADAINFIINQTEMQVIFCDNLRKVNTANSSLETMKSIKLIIVMEVAENESGTYDELKARLHSEHGIHLLKLSEVETTGSSLTKHMLFPSPDDTAMLCYTSGTTGTPKGVILSHKNIVAEASAAVVELRDRRHSGLTPQDTYFSFLPMAHMYEQTAQTAAFMCGLQVAFYRGDLKVLLEDMKLVKPTFMCLVPRVLNRIYNAVNARINSAGFVTKMLYRRALSVKAGYLQQGIVCNNSIYDRLVFNKIRDSIGGRLRVMFIGSAPLAPEVFQWARCVLGAIIAEGYGQTEAVSCVTLTLPYDSQAGHIGAPICCNKVKLVDAPELGYYVKDNKGEICIKGHNCTVGYFKDPENTRQLIDSDGWLHSGDIAALLPNGALKIIDRRKHIFKLAQGEYLAPERIETVYAQCEFIAQVYVDGSGVETFPVAVVVPDQAAIEKWASQRGMAKVSLDELCQNKALKDVMLNSLYELGKKAKFNGFEHVRALHLTTRLFSVENGLLTPTMKNRRPELRKYYADVIKQLYIEANSNVNAS